MDLNKETYDTIDRFLRGQMSKRENSDFEKKISEDKVLGEIVDTEREIVKGIRRTAKNDFKKNLDEIHATIKDRPNDSGTVDPKKKNYWWGLIVFLALLGVATYLLWPKSSGSTNDETSEIPYAAARPNWTGAVALYDESVLVDNIDFSTAEKITEINTLIFTGNETQSYTFNLKEKQLLLYLPNLIDDQKNPPVLYQQVNNYLLELNDVLYFVEETPNKSPLKKIEK